MQARALVMGRAAPQKKEGAMSALLRVALACLPRSETVPDRDTAEATG